MSRFEQSKIDKYNDICNTPKVSAKQLVDKILEGAFNLADLTQLEDPKKTAVDNMLKIEEKKRPNKSEQTEWSAINIAANDLRTNIHLLDAYIKKWSSLRPAQHHVDEAEAELAKLMADEWSDIVAIATHKKELPVNWKNILFDYIVVYENDYSQKHNVDAASVYLKNAINNQFNLIADNHTLIGQHKISALYDFVADNTKYPVSAEFMKKAEDEIDALKCKIEEERWALVNKSDYESLRNYLLETPDSLFISEIDDFMWRIASSRGIDFVKKYMIDIPSGKYINEARRILEYMSEWEAIQKTNDISAIHRYIQNNPNSPFVNDAYEIIHRLKEFALQDFYTNRQKKSHRDIEDLCSGGILSYDDFVRTGITTEKIRTKNTYETLEEIEDFETVTVSSIFAEASQATGNLAIPLGHTDIFLFGVPTSGKTSVSMGLFNCKPELKIIDATKRVGYSEMLDMYVDYCRMPDGTSAESTFLTQCEIKEGRIIHPVNIIDMAGEVIAEKIARGDSETSLSDIPNMTKLLNTNNKKAIFFIIDPTSDIIQIKNSAGNRIVVQQSSVISRIVNLLNADRNIDVLNKIDAIHFIVTKSDMLGEDQESRLNCAYDLMMDKYQGVIDQVTDMSKEYNINISSNNMPTMYVFSLGEFYIGNSVVYNKEDSANIIEVIKEATRGVKKANALDKIKNFFNS